MIEVKLDDSFVPGLEDEAIGVEHLLSEPKNDYFYVDTCLDMKDLSCRFGDGCRTYHGPVASNRALQGEVPNFGELEGFVDEMLDFDAANGLSSPCDDFLLDVEFAERVSEPDSGPCDGSHLGDSCSESHSPGFSGFSNGDVSKLESSTELLPEWECNNNVNHKRVICELHGAFTSKCCCQTPKENLDEMEKNSDLLTESVAYNENRKIHAEANKAGAPVQKRMRKPTRRYIEESSALKAHHLKETQSYTTQPKDRSSMSGYDKEHHCRKRLKAMTLVRAGDSVSRTSAQAPLKSGLRRGFSKNFTPVSSLESDEDSSTTESEDDFVTEKKPKSVGDRRKHQRMWTLSEVTKLVDGISQYGVGRWTEIKRILFPSSTYRTPIDLRDKWRNLLRASCVHKQSKREVEHKQNHTFRPLPKSVLRRICELAKIHPYPKLHKPDNNGVSPTLPTKRMKAYEER